MLMSFRHPIRANTSTAFVHPSFCIRRTKHTSTTRNSLSFWAIGITKNTTSYCKASSALPIRAVSNLSQVSSIIVMSPFRSYRSLGSGLIYFAQNSSYLPPIAGSSPAPVTSAVGFNENATLPFVPGRTYRLRIINTAAFSAFYFWIDGHDMRIIEADGVSIPSCL